MPPADTPRDLLQSYRGSPPPLLNRCAGCSNPYNSSMLTLQLRDLNAISPRTMHTVTIYKSNKIKAYCGHPTNSKKLMIGTNATGTVKWMSIESSPLIGNGCQEMSSCNLHGTCDYCYNTCTCDKGYGNPLFETYEYGAVRIDCAERTCPHGKVRLARLCRLPGQMKCRKLCSLPSLFFFFLFILFSYFLFLISFLPSSFSPRGPPPHFSP